MTDQELTAAIREVQERARANAPEGPLGPEGVIAADLLPLVHARDAAEAKVAAIGTVNPRPPGLKNSIAQSFKKLIARALDWHVREQVEFNHASIMCVQATMEAMTTLTRSMAALARHHQELTRQLQVAGDMQASLAEFEQRAVTAEIRVLRTISELQVGYQYRLNQLEDSYKNLTRAQHRDYEDLLDRKVTAVQQQLWTDIKRVRDEFQQLIHYELRLARQKAVKASVEPASSSSPATSSESIPIDWHAFAHRFRGSEERIQAQQVRYTQRFAGTEGEILDLGCGRGEFLDAARAAGLRARGIELSQECVGECRAKGLEAECADMFAYLEGQPDRSVAGVRCAQVVEHLPPAAVARFVALLGRTVLPGALVAIETPNPECLAIFATHFYIDPTHTRPVPAALLHFYLEEAGFGNIEIQYLEPAVESFPAIQELPAGVRELFFGGLDYAIFARKL